MVCRYHADGSIDTTFGTDGRIAGISNTETFVGSLLALNNGKILLSGIFRNQAGDYECPLMRFTATGITDNSYGNNGISIIPEYINQVSFASMLWQNDDKIIISGRMNGPDSYSRFLVARINENGSLDQSFGTNGTITTLLIQPYTHLERR